MHIRTELNNFASGLQYVASAPKFMLQHHLLRYYAFILIILVFVAIANFKLSTFVIDAITQMAFSNLLSFENTSIWQGVGSKIWFFISTLFSAVIALMMSFYIILIVLSPLFSFLAEKSISIITQRKFEFSFALMCKNIVRSCYIVVRNLALQIIMTILVGILLIIPGIFIPGMSLIATLLIFLTDSFFLGFSMADYSMEVLGLNAKGSISFASRHKGLITAIGLPYTLTKLLPFVGLAIALFVAPLCVVGAARAFAEAEEEKKDF